jgi:hypothetical protein
MMEKNNGRIELSEVMKDPEMAKQIEAIISYVEKTPFSKMFPTKFKAITKDKVLKKTRLLFDENPTLPIKNVVGIVLTSLNDDLSASLVVDMTRVVIDKWTRLKSAVHAENEVEELV